MTAFREFARVGLGISLALALIIAGAILLWGKAAAHDYNPPKQWDTSITPTTTSVDTRYSSEILSAASDYTLNTDLRVDYCFSPCGNILHYENDHGMSGWGARAYSQGTPTNFGIIQWNAYGGEKDSLTANRLARHELEHVFGLDHVPCGGGPYETSPASIMGCPDSGVSDLHDHDISDINGKY